MKALVRLLLAGLLAFGASAAQASRSFEPAEREALLAPVALYPDPLLLQILDASRHPQDVQAAAAWSRANPQLSGDAALATVQGTAWAESVKALVAYPELLQRMAESPQWLQDLGEAYATYGPNIMATVQELRARAQASGYLQSNGEQNVYQQGEDIVVQPAYPSLAYAPYYNPYVVYGGWSWTVFRPVYWRPWIARPHIITRVIIAPPVHLHRHFDHRRFDHKRFDHRRFDHRRFDHRRPAIVQGGPVVRPFRPVPESRRPPFVQSRGSPFIHSAPPVVRGTPEPRRFVGPGVARPDGGRRGGLHRGHGGGHGGRHGGRR